MKFHAAVIENQGITFALVRVDKEVLDVPGRARDAVATLQSIFKNMSIVLMALDAKGTPKYYGRPDIVSNMGNATFSDAEWKEYTLD